MPSTETDGCINACVLRPLTATWFVVSTEDNGQ